MIDITQSAAGLGCSADIYRRLMDMPSDPIGKYRAQRRQAVTRSIEWGFTLETWWQVWESSGHWDQRGTGSGYVMARIRDTGPYKPGNVRIITASANVSEWHDYGSRWRNPRPHIGSRAASVGGSLHEATWSADPLQILMQEESTEDSLVLG